MVRSIQRIVMLLAVIATAGLASSGWSQTNSQDNAESDGNTALPPLAHLRLPREDPIDAISLVAQVVMSHGGQLLAVRKSDHSVQLWDLATVQRIRTWYHLAGPILDICFSVDDKLIHAATGSTGPGIRTWDVATGKVLADLSFPALKADAAIESTVWAVNSSGAVELNVVAPHAGNIDRFAGKVIPLHVDAQRKMVVGYERISGNLGEQYALSFFRFDEKFGIVRGWPNNDSRALTIRPAMVFGLNVTRPLSACIVKGVQEDTIVYCVAGVRRITTQRIGARTGGSWDAKSHALCLAASPDGRFIAAGGEDGRVRLWEMLTGGFVGEFSGVGGRVAAIDFSADTRFLVSGSTGSTDRLGVVVWSVGALLSNEQQRPTSSTLSRTQFHTAWRQMADSDPAQAVEAIGQFMTAPETAMRFVSEEIASSIQIPSQNEIELLVQDMRDSRYSVRTEAYRRLFALRDIIADELQRALERGQPTEVQLQLKRILAHRNTKQNSDVAKVRQAIRTIWFLEVIGDSQALVQIKRLEMGHRSAEVRETARRIRKARFGDR
jgi:hypothetical protein